MKRLIIILLLLSLFSCKEILKETLKSTSNSSVEHLSDGSYKQVDVNGLYSLSIPDYMKEMNNLNEEATLQYANIYKEAYTIVIHENKEEFVSYFKELNEYDDSKAMIENYGITQKKFFEESMQIDNVEDYGLVKIKNYPARQIKIKGSIDDQKIGYVITFIEGDENIFMIMNWTLLDRLNKYENTFETISNSFKLLKN